MRLLVLVIALTLSAPPSLLAQAPGGAPDTELSPRGKSAIENLERLTKSVDLTDSPLGLATQAEVERRLDELEALLERCELYLEQVPPGDKKHQRYLRLEAFISDFGSAVSGWRGDLAGAAARQVIYRKAVKRHSTVLGVLDDLAHGRAQATGMLEQPMRSWKAAQALAPFTKDCAKRFAGLRDLPKLHAWLQPRVACANAPRARELLGEHLRASSKAFVRELTQRYESVLGAFEQDGTIDDHFLLEFLDFDGILAGWRSSLEEVYEAIGESMPPTMLDLLAALGPRFATQLQVELKKNRMPAADHPERVVRRAVDKYWRTVLIHEKPAKTVAVRVFTPEWAVETAESFGTPVARTKLAHVLARAHGEPFCRLYILSVRQEHFARGEYKPNPRVNIEDRPKLLDCKSR